MYIYRFSLWLAVKKMDADRLIESFSQLLTTQQQWMTGILADQKAMMDKFAAGASPKSEAAASLPVSHIPVFPPFDKRKQSWKSFVDQLNQHFYAYNVVTDDQKKAFFLSWSGPELYELIRNLFAGKKVEEESFAVLIAKLTVHFADKTHVLAARYGFFQMRMKESQTYAE